MNKKRHQKRFIRKFHLVAWVCCCSIHPNFFVLLTANNGEWQQHHSKHSTNDNKQNCFLFIFIAYFSPSIHSLRITILPPTLLHTFTNKRGNSDGTKEKRKAHKTHRKNEAQRENWKILMELFVSPSPSHSRRFQVFSPSLCSHLQPHRTSIYTLSIPLTINQKRKFLVFTQSATKGRNLPTT